MNLYQRKLRFVRRRPQLSLMISFVKGLIVGELICYFL